MHKDKAEMHVKRFTKPDAQQIASASPADCPESLAEVTRWLLRQTYTEHLARVLGEKLLDLRATIAGEVGSWPEEKWSQLQLCENCKWVHAKLSACTVETRACQALCPVLACDPQGMLASARARALTSRVLVRERECAIAGVLALA
eukprot:4722521-Pleurochrysis_carterae.AAC.3